MQFKTALLGFILLICPLALCYGQLSFLSTNGERGYSAMRTSYKLELDNNFIFTPLYAFYRQSDAPHVEKTGTVHRYGLKSAYDVSDEWNIYARVFLQPKAVGSEAVTYGVGGRWNPFYRYGIVQDPFIDLHLGQVRSRTDIDVHGNPLEESYPQIETNTHVSLGADVGPWNLQAAWHKVIQYNNHIRNDVSLNWADIPFMTAVVQGFLREALAVRASYPTDFITPYASAVRYEYAETAHSAIAFSAGLKMKWEEASFSGGIEVFEPRREETRKTFFSVSVEVNF